MRKKVTFPHFKNQILKILNLVGLSSLKPKSQTLFLMFNNKFLRLNNFAVYSD
jgi:hypothetical protein